MWKNVLKSTRAPRYLEKFEHMVDSDRPLDRISQVNLDLNLKLAPSSFRHLLRDVNVRLTFYLFYESNLSKLTSYALISILYSPHMVALSLFDCCWRSYHAV